MELRRSSSARLRGESYRALKEIFLSLEGDEQRAAFGRMTLPKLIDHARSETLATPAHIWLLGELSKDPSRLLTRILKKSFAATDPASYVAAGSALARHAAIEPHDLSRVWAVSWITGHGPREQLLEAAQKIGCEKMRRPLARLLQKKLSGLDGFLQRLGLPHASRERFVFRASASLARRLSCTRLAENLIDALVGSRLTPGELYAAVRAAAALDLPAAAGPLLLFVVHPEPEVRRQALGALSHSHRAAR
jgi:hypothetical protein